MFTVSPVRHKADGIHANNLSKARLLLAIDNVIGLHGTRALYFPAYELVMDDLRDYRFYADDLAHPAPQAVEYIWEKFTAAALDDEARHLLPEVEALVTAAHHRSRNPHSEAHREFCRKCLARIAALPANIDFTEEKRDFEHYAD